MQSVPVLSPSRMVQMVTSITAKEIFRRAPSVKTKLWGGAFWSSAYFINTVGRHGSAEAIRRYVQEQGTEKHYRCLHSQQMELF